uniref:Putative secreted protein n=1 Tax=Ixodes ricinus TaxID=34613 RepID=A0A6B0TS57_IXORI
MARFRISCLRSLHSSSFLYCSSLSAALACVLPLDGADIFKSVVIMLPEARCSVRISSSSSLLMTISSSLN